MTFDELNNICQGKRDFKGLPINSLKDNFKTWLASYKAGNDEFKSNLSGMTKYRLTEEEALYILGYTGSMSQWMNSELRNSKKVLCECKKAVISELDKSLSKIPSFTSEIVYRMDGGCGGLEEEVEWFKKQVGKIIRIPYFLSTSKDDYKNSDIVWIINTHNSQSHARDVSELTNVASEKEVLFSRNSTFKIIDVELNEDMSKLYIHLEELNFNSQYDFDLTGCYTTNIP